VQEGGKSREKNMTIKEQKKKKKKPDHHFQFLLPLKKKKYLIENIYLKL